MTEFLQSIMEWFRINLQGEIIYVLLIVVLFIMPRLLIRYGIPMAMTAFLLGLLSGQGFNFYADDEVIPIFSTLGIISLFLFAGLEVNLAHIKKYFRSILGHLGVRLIVLALLATIFMQVFGLIAALAVVLALALATPSTGFILDSLETTDLPEEQKYWITIKAIAAELVALGALIVFSQLNDLPKLFTSVVIILLMVVGLPYLLTKVAKKIEKHAPGSEFSFIFMLAIIAGLITKKLGAYYLVGAFIVGMAAGQYKRNTNNPNTERMIDSLKSFSSFFMPFYFFYSGLRMPIDAFSLESVKISLFFLLVVFPVKITSIVLVRRFTINEKTKDSFAIAISLMPNLVFGLVLAEILRSQMGLSLNLYGGLIIYTLTITMISPLILRLVSDNSDLQKVSRIEQQ